MCEKNLMKNFDFINREKSELLKIYNNKFLLVFEEKIIGAFDTYENAAEEGIRLYGIEGNFLIYHLVEKEPLNFIMEANI